MGNIADDMIESSESTCECGAPLDEEGDCTNIRDCLAQIEREERKAPKPYWAEAYQNKKRTKFALFLVNTSSKAAAKTIVIRARPDATEIRIGRVSEEAADALIHFPVHRAIHLSDHESGYVPRG